MSEPFADDPWVSPTGVVAHPDAPAGGGGFGSFRGAAPLGSADDVFDPFPRPQSPAARQLDPDLLQDKAEELQQAPQKAGPMVTADKTQKVNGIDVTIKADDLNGTKLKEGNAGTEFSLDPGTIPDTATDQPDGVDLDKKKHKITAILGKQPVITGTIQTRYQDKTVPTNTSAYGRGTTDQDKKNGDTSVAFHESCHRQDALDYLKNNKLPKFMGRVGMTVEEWEKAVDDYNNAVFKYTSDADADSETKSDETGNPTKSQFNATP